VCYCGCRSVGVVCEVAVRVALGVEVVVVCVGGVCVCVVCVRGFVWRWRGVTVLSKDSLQFAASHRVFPLKTRSWSRRMLFWCTLVWF